MANEIWFFFSWLKNWLSMFWFIKMALGYKSWENWIFAKPKKMAASQRKNFSIKTTNQNSITNTLVKNGWVVKNHSWNWQVAENHRTMVLNKKTSHWLFTHDFSFIFTHFSLRKIIKDVCVSQIYSEWWLSELAFS